ncbi:MAG: Ppx/GppA phosphatase family protein [Pyrinomonadaceae bacterium]
MKIAAIDIGSNSIKLIVVDAAASDSFAVLAREKETVRLGRSTLREGYLSPSAIERAAACIKRFNSIAEARGAERVVAIATASVREANNAAEFIEQVEGETGVRVEVLSGVEEARLIGLAVAQSCAARSNEFVNIDIGGGSTEISLVRDGIPAELYSLRLGAVGLTERFITGDPVRPKELRALREEIRAALERPSRELRGARWQQATGTSGTILALGASLGAQSQRGHEREQREQGAQPVGAEIVFGQLENFNARVAGMTTAERRALPGISAQRAEILVGGGQILEGVMRSLGINLLRTCDWALREGVVVDQLRELEAESRPPVPDLADARLRGVHAVGRRFAYEEAHALQVARLAEKIFDSLAPAFSLSRHQRLLLSAAALLHDAGYTIAHESHHKHSLYLIKHSELTGFSEAERNVIANIARYHRAALPKERHPDYVTLNQADRATVCRLGAILRVADALDRSHDGRVEDVACTREGQNFQLALLSALDCEKEIWAAEQRSDLFEQVFKGKLTVSQRGAPAA